MFEAIKRMFARSNREDKMSVVAVTNDAGETQYMILTEDGSPYAGPYKREKDAKGQLTRLRTSYSPASRRPQKDA